MRRGIFHAVVLAIVLVAGLAAPASAYIDGGSTTILFQTLVAGTAAAGLSAKLAWKRLRSFGGRRTGADASLSEEPVRGIPEGDRTSGE